MSSVHAEQGMPWRRRFWIGGPHLYGPFGLEAPPFFSRQTLFVLDHGEAVLHNSNSSDRRRSRYGLGRRGDIQGNGAAARTRAGTGTSSRTAEALRLLAEAIPNSASPWGEAMVPAGGVLSDASTPGACHRSGQAGFVQ